MSDDPVVTREFFKVLAEQIGLPTFFRFCESLEKGLPQNIKDFETMWRKGTRFAENELKRGQMMDLIWKHSGSNKIEN